MFNWTLFLFFIGIGIPGILLLIPTNVKIYNNIKSNLLKNKKHLSKRLFIISSTFQTLMIVILSAFIGIKAQYKTNFQLFNWNTSSAMKSIVFFSLLGAVIFLFSYYFVFRPRLDIKTRESMENLRFTTGFLGRIFYGGIVEEIICRWGLMSLFAWVGIILFGYSTIIIWISILFSGFLFAIGHLPGYFAFGCIKTKNFILMVVVLNMWAASVFGWLFLNYGLSTAIISHIIFHVVWYPVDLFFKTNSGIVYE